MTNVCVRAASSLHFLNATFYHHTLIKLSFNVYCVCHCQELIKLIFAPGHRLNG